MPERSLLQPDVTQWLRRLAQQDEDALLVEMRELAHEHSFPIVGPEVGRLLAQLSRAVGARRIFEMGSGFGYSTLWLARAVGPDGQVVYTDTDPQQAEAARRFLERAGVAERVTLLVGDACQHLAASSGLFDIIFCDVEKEQYPAAYQLLRDRIRVGGAAIVDNLLWSGRVVAGDTDPATAGVREYIRLMWSDADYLSSLLPVRDGVGLSVRVA